MQQLKDAPDAATYALSFREIDEKVGLDKSTVCSWMKKHKGRIVGKSTQPCDYEMPHRRDEKGTKLRCYFYTTGDEAQLVMYSI